MDTPILPEDKEILAEMMPEDSKIMVEMLHEYADRVMGLCQEWERAKDSYEFRLGVVAVCSLAVVLAYLYLILPAISLSPSPFSKLFDSIIFATGTMVLVVFLGTTWLKMQRRRRRWIDKEIAIAANQLAHLIRLSSQVREHVVRGYGGKIYFDVRLAEAETALRYSELITGINLSQGTRYVIK